MPELSFLIRPLGPLLAHQGMSRVPVMPDALRLFDALAASAWNQGMTSRFYGALAWLESHPPIALQWPQVMMNSAPWAFRDTSEYRSQAKVGYVSPKKKERAEDLISVDGPFGWSYGEAPADIINALSELCAGVAYLGESPSRVDVDCAPITPTHTTAMKRAAFRAVAPDAMMQQCATAGRLVALESVYQELRTDKKTRDALAQSERTEDEAMAGKATLVATPVRPALADVPWTYGWAFLTQRPLKPTERVQWAVAMHRAIVARLGDQASPMVTGHFDGPRPANHVTIQYVEGPTDDDALSDGGFVIAAPPSMSADERHGLERALESLSYVNRSGVGAVNLSYHGPINPATLWKPVTPGYRRVWRTAVPMVIEIERPRQVSSWYPEDAVDVSLGFVLRHRLNLRGVSRSRMATETIRQIHELGLYTEQADLVPDSVTEHVAHSMRPGVPCVALEAWIRDDGALGSQALCAIGQARHLGGGLLVPEDEEVEA